MAEPVAVRKLCAFEHVRFPVKQKKTTTNVGCPKTEKKLKMPILLKMSIKSKNRNNRQKHAIILIPLHWQIYISIIRK